MVLIVTWSKYQEQKKKEQRKHQTFMPKANSADRAKIIEIEIIICSMAFIHFIDRIKKCMFLAAIKENNSGQKKIECRASALCKCI